MKISLKSSHKKYNFVNPILDSPSMQALQLTSNMGQEATLESDHLELMNPNALTLIPQHMTNTTLYTGINWHALNIFLF